MSAPPLLRWLGLAVALTVSASAHADWRERVKGFLEKPTDAAAEDAGSSESLSQADITTALKETLTRGANAAVAQLGQKDGFFGNRELRIPLPPALKKVESGLRAVGMGAQADELILSMNRAAEAAVPEARALLVQAVQNMTLTDARNILTGGATAATDYFREKTEGTLTERFKPIVAANVQNIGLAQQYDRYASAAARYKLIDEKQAAVDDYVTRESLNRLYTVIGEHEAELRADPRRAGSELLKKVFESVTGG